MRMMPLLLLAALSGAASAAPVDYNIEPEHTYPSFEADHMGISTWRGKFNKSSGSATVDKAAGTGSISITVDINSIDFGHDVLNDHVKTEPGLFNAAKYPTATYKAKLVDFKDGAPTRATGDLTLNGVTKPVDLKINSFKCIQHPFYKKEACGADAYAVIKRDDFGIDAGKAWGFNMDVVLRIQVEAVAAK